MWVRQLLNEKTLRNFKCRDAVSEAVDGQIGLGSDARSIYADIPQFGGPTSVGGQLAEDADVVPQFRLQGLQDHFEPWYRFKERLNDCHGLQFNVDESIFYQVATDSLGETDAASGLVRVYGQWELLGRGSENPGMLVFKGENRHRIGTAITPFDLGFEAGSILPTGTFFSEFDFGVTNLYWKQYFFDRRLAVAVGGIDVTDFVDVYAMMNPLTHFINLAFSTNPTIAVPNQGLGAAAGGMLTDRLYVQGGFGDANGQPTRPDSTRSSTTPSISATSNSVPHRHKTGSISTTSMLHCGTPTLVKQPGRPKAGASLSPPRNSSATSGCRSSASATPMEMPP